eukprot:scaffold85320_cov19-Tisochrysis_lutea.AAC.1
MGVQAPHQAISIVQDLIRILFENNTKKACGSLPVTALLILRMHTCCPGELPLSKVTGKHDTSSSSSIRHSLANCQAAQQSSSMAALRHNMFREVVRLTL